MANKIMFHGKEFSGFGGGDGLYRGAYDSLVGLETAYPSDINGAYAIVIENGEAFLWAWSTADSEWVADGGGGQGGGEHVEIIYEDYQALQQAGTVDPAAVYFIENSLESGGGETTEDETPIEELLAAKEDVINKGALGGYAPLDDAGKVPQAYLPSLATYFRGYFPNAAALTTAYPADIAGAYAIVANESDNLIYIWNAALSQWIDTGNEPSSLPSGTFVESVNGQPGPAVTLNYAAVGAAPASHATDMSKHLTASEKTAVGRLYFNPGVILSNHEAPGGAVIGGVLRWGQIVSFDLHFYLYAPITGTETVGQLTPGTAYNPTIYTRLPLHTLSTLDLPRMFVDIDTSGHVIITSRREGTTAPQTIPSGITVFATATWLTA
jgi:hypothetical protein